ncbi:MAG TPA: hypothetical protein VMV18_04550 [bacterium]|nr:hypothetical protein [bacterium]
MKSWVAAVTVGAFVANVGLGSVAFAAPKTSSPEPVGVEKNDAPSGASANAKPDAGGLAPCLLECYLGPRVGSEYNEGRNFSTLEILQIIPYVGGIFRLILAAQSYQGKTMTEYAKENALDSRPIASPHGTAAASKGGLSACLIGCYLGPRIAFEHNEGRRIRTYDILRLVIIGGILESLEAYNGKTMTQIAKDEGLDS